MMSNKPIKLANQLDYGWFPFFLFFFSKRNCGDNLKMVFTSSKILSLFLESLGLDITSGIFHCFQNDSNIPPIFFFQITS